MKKCPRCSKQRKFSRNRASSDGLDAWCKVCKSAWSKDYYKRHPHLRRNYRKANLSLIFRWQRDYRLRTKYGLTEILFKRILKLQRFRCAICKTKKPGGKYKSWHVDHDHKTGKVRGLLCFNCNKHLGYFERIAKQILKYLKNPPAPKVVGRQGATPIH
jgi:hypothetical protein